MMREFAGGSSKFGANFFDAPAGIFFLQTISPAHELFIVLNFGRQANESMYQLPGGYNIVHSGLETMSKMP